MTQRKTLHQIPPETFSLKHLGLLSSRKCFLCGTSYAGGVHGFGLPGHDDCTKSLEVKLCGDARALIASKRVLANTRPGYAGPSYHFDDMTGQGGGYCTYTFQTILCRGIPGLVPDSATLKAVSQTHNPISESALRKQKRKESQQVSKMQNKQKLKNECLAAKRKAKEAEKNSTNKKKTKTTTTKKTKRIGDDGDDDSDEEYFP